jgi:hypothetical protein
MSPGRWEQVIPAACMNTGRPGSCAVPASQVARSREVSRAGSPPPPASERVSGLVTLPRPGSVPPEVTAGERRRGQQRPVVAGQHRHGPRRPPAADGRDDAARPADDVGAARVAQVGADQPGARPEAGQPGRPRPPRRRGLGAGQRQVAGDLARRVRLLGPLTGQRHIGRVQVRHHLPGDEPQAGAQRPPRRPGQARPVRGEALDHRRVQQHLRHRVQPDEDAVAGELAGRPQQVLGPVPAQRPARRDDLPGERRCLRRGARRRPRRRCAAWSTSGASHPVIAQRPEKRLAEKPWIGAKLGVPLLTAALHFGGDAAF